MTFTQLRASFASVLCLTACAAAPDDLGEASHELRGPFLIEAAHGAQLLGLSADGRRAVYGTACDTESATLRLRDDRTAKVVTLATDAACAPGSIVFSPDGQLVGFGNGRGEIRVYDVRARKVAVVSRPAQSAIGIAFSPDSQWFVVASALDSGAAGLDAWDVDLSGAHEIAASAFFSPFAMPAESIRFHPDGSALLFVGDVPSGLPLGTLRLFERATGTSRVLARDVGPGWLVRDDWKQVVVLRGITLAPGEPPSPTMPGDLARIELDSGNEVVIERGVAASPLAFARCDVIVYAVDAALGAPATLKAFGGGAGHVIDTGVFRGFGPGATVAKSPRGDTLAYFAGLDPMRFEAELRTAALPRCDANALEQKTIATGVVPMSARFVGDGEAIAYLRGATSSMPGASIGTLAVTDLATGTATDVATDVAIQGLATDPSSHLVRYVEAYEPELAAGELTVFDTRSGAKRKLGEHAAVMSIQTSPNGDHVGFVAITPDPSGEGLPATALYVTKTLGRTAPTLVANDVTTFSLGNNGRVLYAKSDGIYRAQR